MTPNDLTWSTISMLSNDNDRWNRTGQGRLKMISFVLLIFSIILFSLVQFFICSNSATMSTSMCSGTRRSTSSTYLFTKLIAERDFRSFLVIIYRVGPKPEPCIILRVMLSNCEHTPFTIHFCWRPVRKETIQLYILLYLASEGLIVYVVIFHDLQHQKLYWSLWLSNKHISPCDHGWDLFSLFQLRTETTKYAVEAPNLTSSGQVFKNHICHKVMAYVL